MKLKPTPILHLLWLVLALAGQPALRAQEDPPPPAPAAKIEEKPAAPAPAAEAPAEPDKDGGQLRELGADDKTEGPATKPAGKARKPGPVSIQMGRHRSDNARVGFGEDSTLEAGQQADAVVSIIGSSTSAGEVSDAIVSVVGSTRVTGGTVGEAAVAVLGNVYINGHVHGDVVAVLGNIELGPDAVIDGQIVHVGGELKRDAKAVVNGPVQNIALGGGLANFDGLSAWFHQCFLYARPLAFGGHLGWAWGIAFAFLAFYCFLALVAPEGVNKCVQTLEDRPGYSILSAVLTLLLTPVVFILLALTLFIGIGFALIPLLSLGLFFAGLFGKVVMLGWLGRRLIKLAGTPSTHPVLGVLLGGVIVLGLYTVPVAGFIIYKLLGVLGLGVVVYTLILSMKSSRAAAAAATAAAAAATAAAVPPSAVDAPPSPPVMLPPILSAVTLPRAGFWRRFAAAFLDFIMVAIVFSMLQKIFRGFADILPLWFTVYCVVMWATKGTTVGGIVCGLRLVRLDDRPIDWGMACVRALGGFLSLAVAGLGFIWVAFDDEKQSWHDKIAGTTIVIVPKGTALL